MDESTKDPKDSKRLSTADVIAATEKLGHHALGHASDALSGSDRVASAALAFAVNTGRVLGKHVEAELRRMAPDALAKLCVEFTAFCAKRKISADDAQHEAGAWLDERIAPPAKL